MIIDVTMEDDRFTIVFLKRFFELEQMDFVRPKTSRLISEIYAYLGNFLLPGESLGFEGCMKKTGEDSEYFFFSFPFPEQQTVDRHGKSAICFSREGSFQMERFIGSLHLLSDYCLRNAVHGKKFQQEELRDQSLMFSFGMKSGHSFVSGEMFPWFKQQLAVLPEDGLADLNRYVEREMDRFSVYSFGEPTFCRQVAISGTYWFVQGAIDGVWVNSEKSSESPMNIKFHSHNCDRSVDQRNLFAAVVAMNTWLRGYAANQDRSK